MIIYNLLNCHSLQLKYLLSEDILTLHESSSDGESEDDVFILIAGWISVYRYKNDFNIIHIRPSLLNRGFYTEV